MDSVAVDIAINLITSGVIIAFLTRIYYKLGKIETNQNWI